MKGFVFCLLMVCVLALGACASSGTNAAALTPTPKPVTTHYTVRLSALNGSDVSGTIDLQLTGNTLAVTTNVTGLMPNQIHFQHIHGSHDAVSTCPTSADANASGIITVDKALLKIGPVALSFAPYTPADLHGAVRWSKTFFLDSTTLWAITPLVKHVVVFHGMISHGAYDSVLPVACGPIAAVSG